MSTGGSVHINIGLVGEHSVAIPAVGRPLEAEDKTRLGALFLVPMAVQVERLLHSKLP